MRYLIVATAMCAAAYLLILMRPMVARVLVLAQGGAL